MYIKYCLSLFLTLCLLSSCNKDEGLGGSSSLEGYVYEIVHSNDNFSFITDTFPALNKDILLEFGGNDYSIGERKRTGREGYYRFDYLREGNYTVYAISGFADGHDEAVAQKVRVSGKHNKADTIFIHTGKAVGTAQIRGVVWVKYYNKGSLVRVNGQDSVPAVETRVFIKNTGEETFFDDVRVSDAGVFVFQKIQPQKQYEVYVNTEIPGESNKNILFPLLKKVDVGEVYRTYPLGNEEKLEFTIIVNN
ncbi:hypothetical protein MK137Hg34_000206700 [Viscerimonas tarda]